ncbi:MAG: HAMP domain-containing histidine kinase [Planctomycetes bacterium]|nr:HAMP domain-containing histidine kinase [Planctomycetota bacterium]
MSYRTIKKLLGETSLERKFRFLFGGGLLLLIASSFWFANRMNKSLVDDLNRRTARMLVSSVVLEKHLKSAEGNSDVVELFDTVADELKSDEHADFQWIIYKADPSTVSPDERPDVAGTIALEELRGGRAWHEEILTTEGKYNYYAPLHASQICIDCHWHKDRNPKPGNTLTEIGAEPEPVELGELLGMVKITLPLDETQKALSTNSAYLWATAIIIAALAMTAAYAIVRYVIVKPLLHLKEVSDDIAHGILDRRADIRTGDEFEELGHAFNRMLRHLTTVQDELRHVNIDLDAKVDELAHVNLSLYEMNKLKDEFLATMSHELRTPLNSILGFSDVLQSAENLTDKQHRFLQNIQTSGNNLMVLINDLLDLSKIESGKMELQIVDFSLFDLVERQVSSLMPLAEKKNIDLTFSIHSSFPILFQDSGKLRQILNNLLSNAVKFTPEGGRVRVTAESCNDELFDLIVEDTGIGIPLEEQESIFEKFRQGKTIPGQSDAMTREYEGTGLGLSIVKELSKLLGGEIFLDSEFGKGSTFTVRLPKHLEEKRNLIQELNARIDEIKRIKEYPEVPMAGSGDGTLEEADNIPLQG